MSLKHMFTVVASTYDLINSVLTIGFDEIWRILCAKECVHSGFVADLCCGTGLLSKHLTMLAPEAYVIGIDFSKAMLKRAKARVKRHTRNVGFILADVASLPLKDGCFDSVCSSFSLRNLLYKNPKATVYLKEIMRILRHDGKFVCIETSQPKGRLLRILYHLYLQKVVPFIGWLISGNIGAYKYLGISAINFPPAEKIKSILLNAGFRKVSFRYSSFGIVALHIGVK